ncbi:hypothetical protein C7H85_10020 [Zobellella endophytica]|uniref:Uncharacterized protein n=1 Tax=Zobellella endophytica TaxID=2116700 RepID=A0A2P7R678_9GAMM|nr:hypothetical protein C7H85_10020 [Zobellella endophytica]
MQWLAGKDKIGRTDINRGDAVKCPSCENIIRPAQVTERESHGLNVHFHCPHCRARLAVNGRATRAKLMGFVLLLSGSGVMLWGPERSWVFGLMVCVAGGVLAISARRKEQQLRWLDKPGGADQN